MSVFSPNNQIVHMKAVRKVISEFAKYDNWHNLDLQSGNLGYGWIHYSLIRNLKPDNILIIGSRYGYVPAVCAIACRDNHHGHIDFVDANYDQDNPMDVNHWGGVGYWTTAKGRQAFKKFGLQTFISVSIMTSAEFINENKHKKWAYIYLDGDHSFKGIQSDFKSFWNHVTKGGFIGVHDINTPNSLGNLNYGVHKFWQHLKSTHRYGTIEIPGLCGLGLVQKE